jgi:hypothetical protein
MGRKLTPLTLSYAHMSAFVVLHAMTKKQVRSYEIRLTGKTWIWITAVCNQFNEEDRIPGYERDLQRVYHKHLVPLKLFGRAVRYTTDETDPFSEEAGTNTDVHSGSTTSNAMGQMMEITCAGNFIQVVRGAEEESVGVPGMLVGDVRRPNSRDTASPTNRKQKLDRNGSAHDPQPFQQNETSPNKRP